MTRFGGHSHVDRVLRVDRRTREGRLIAELRAKLHAQFPAATVTQGMVIDRLVGTYARLVMLDRRLAEQKRADGRKDPLTIRLYADLNATFLKMLAALGADASLPEAKPPPVALDAYLRATAHEWVPNGAGRGGAA